MDSGEARELVDPDVTWSSSYKQLFNVSKLNTHRHTHTNVRTKQTNK